MTLAEHRRLIFERHASPEPTTGCWLWTGNRTNTGYGIIGTHVGGEHRKVLAHRFSYELHTGKHPGSAFVCHRCDVPLCVNPAHLFLGTHQDNMRDCAAKGRGRVSLGEQNPRAILTEIAVLEILRRLEAGDCQGDIGRDFGVAAKTISNIACGVAWSHVAAKRARAK